MMRALGFLERWDRDRLSAMILVVTAATVGMLSIGGSAITWKLVTGLGAGAAVLLIGGHAILRCFKIPGGPARNTLALLVGIVPLSILIPVGVFGFGRHAGSIFFVWAGLAALLYVLARSWITQASENTLARDRPTGDDAIFEVVCVAVICLVVILWSRHSIQAFPALQSTHRLEAWNDYYIHGSYAVGLSGLWGEAGGMTTVGMPVLPYHYAYLSLSALVSTISTLPGLGIGTGFMLPSALLIMALGIFSVGTVLASRAVGLVCALMFFVLPDAGQHGLANGFLSAHFFIPASPGTGYAAGLGLAAIALAAMSHSGGRGCLALSIATAMALPAFSIMVGALVLPAIVATWLYDRLSDRGWARTLNRAILGMAVLLPMALILVGPLRALWLKYTAGHQFLFFFHTAVPPTGYDGLYLWLEQNVGQSSADAVGFLLTPVAVLGIYLFTLPAAYAISRRVSDRRPFDALPVTMTLGYMAIVLLAPISFLGGPDYQHRQFVLPFATALIWTVVLMVRPARWRQLTNVLAAILAMISFVGVYRQNHDPVRPRFTWGLTHYSAPIGDGLLEVAAFIRSAGTKKDVIVTLPVQAESFFLDEATQLSALLDMQVYLQRPAIYKLYSPKIRQTAADRVEILGSLSALTDFNDAMSRFRTLGVRWVVSLDGPLRFDSTGSHATFRHGKIIVYRSDLVMP